MTPLDSIRYYKFFIRSAIMVKIRIPGYVKAYVGGTIQILQVRRRDPTAQTGGKYHKTVPLHHSHAERIFALLYGGKHTPQV